MSLEESNADTEGKTAATRVPTSADNRTALLADRPSGWEFLLFAGVLKEGKDRLELRWRDHQLRLPTGEYHRVDEEDVATYLGAAFGRLSWIISAIQPVFEGQEDAFGRPGEPGDPALIEHLGGWVVTVYDRLLEWAGTVRSADVGEDFAKAADLCSRSADMPIAAIRAFIDETVAKTEEVGRQLALPEADRKPIRFEVTLTINADDELMQAAVEELKTALGQSD